MAKKSYVKSGNDSHWYAKDGKPKHEADLRVARKEFLYPSPTSIDRDSFVNLFLDSWKRNEVILAAIDNPKQAHESNDDYGERLNKLSLDKAAVAAEFGKRFHDAVDLHPKPTNDLEMAPYVAKFIEGFYRVYVEAKVASEIVLLDHDLGVAGRCDFIGRSVNSYPGYGKTILPDWKTQRLKKKKDGTWEEPNYYDSWIRQLAFYAVAYAKRSGTFPELPICISVVINSVEPTDPFIKVWTNDEVIDAYHDFLIATYCWCRKRNYWPAGPWNVYHALPDPDLNRAVEFKKEAANSFEGLLKPVKKRELVRDVVRAMDLGAAVQGNAQPYQFGNAQAINPAWANAGAQPYPRWENAPGVVFGDANLVPLPFPMPPVAGAAQEAIVREDEDDDED